MDGEQKIEKLFHRWDRYNSPGAAVSVSKAGKLLYAKGFGYSNLEYDIPISSKSIFHVASVSKQFTVMAILLLEKEGKLSVKDDIRKYLDELPELEDIITIEHLIHHTGGLRDQLELIFLSGWRPDDVITQEHLMNMSIRQTTTNFLVDEKFLYSNTGYTFMAEIVKKVSGMSFREYTQKHIFEPLGMENTHFHDDNDEIVKNRAYSYKLGTEGRIKKSVLNYSVVGPTSLFTTVEDMAKWGHNYITCKVGGREIIDYMTTQYRLKSGKKIEYAGGVNIRDYKGLKTIEHNGADAGFRTSMVVFPKEDLVVSVFSNIGTFKPEYYAKKIGELFIDEELIDDHNKFYDYDVLEITSEDPKRYMDIEKIEGKYLIEPGRLIVASVRDDAIYIKLPSTPELKFMYIRDKLLQGENTDVLVEVVEDDNKEIIGLDIINIPSDIRRADRIKIVDRDMDYLKRYIGDYYCRELDTFYKIGIEGNRLIAKHTRSPVTLFVPYGEDCFLSSKGDYGLNGKIVFKKDRHGYIEGFMLNSDRVRNLWFNRVERDNGRCGNEI